MVDVGRDDGAPAGDLVADELGRDGLGNRGAEGMPPLLAQQLLVARVGAQFIQAHVLADGDVFHLGRDHAAARVVHLRDVGAGLAAARRAQVLEAQVRERGVVLAGATEGGAGAVEEFRVAAGLDPGAAHVRQSPQQVDGGVGVGVGARGVVDVDRRVLLNARAAEGRRQRDLAHGYADVRSRTGDITLLRCGKGFGDLVGQADGRLDEILRNSAHVGSSVDRPGHGVRGHATGGGAGAPNEPEETARAARSRQLVRASLRRYQPDQVPRVFLSPRERAPPAGRCRQAIETVGGFQPRNAISRLRCSSPVARWWTVDRQ